MEAAYVAVLILTLVGMGALSFYVATKLFAAQR
jgi:hypothetical protein